MCKPGDELGQIHPVGADVGNGPQVGVTIRLDPPVVVIDQQQPVLGVGTRDREDSAQLATRDASVHLLAERIEAEVVIHARRLLGMGRGRFHQLRSLLGTDRQRLLAEHVFARLEARLACSKWTLLGEAICTALMDGSASSSSSVL